MTTAYFAWIQKSIKTEALKWIIVKMRYVSSIFFYFIPFLIRNGQIQRKKTLKFLLPLLRYVLCLCSVHCGSSNYTATATIPQLAICNYMYTFFVVVSLAFAHIKMPFKSLHLCLWYCDYFLLILRPLLLQRSQLDL